MFDLRGRSWTAAVMAAALVLSACSGSSSNSDDATPPVRKKATGEFATDLPLTVDPDEVTTKATFTISPGTEQVTVQGLEPKSRTSLVDAEGNRLVVLKADKFGQANFAYLPDELAEFQTGAKAKLPTSQGYTVEAGEGYTVRADDADPVQASDPFTILGRDDHPDAAFFDEQSETLVPEGDETKLFGYVTTRDGVQLSVTVRLPGPADQGPYPTVVEYSGYGPSNPGSTEPGTMIAGLLGYATVGVNMRGSGCSGGVFDVFNTAQQVDGYDVIEAVARQPWVKGNKVGMVGLSYSGITQLYVAATNPPSLSAITPLSVITDPWVQQWPGGVYNGGFTKQWLAERDKQSSAGGTSWVAKQIEDGDDICASHIDLREQNLDFEYFGRSLERRPELADERDLSLLVKNIDVPVYLTGAWQDEQTGPQFADMLGNFDNAPVTRFTMFNGRHPDGYLPLNLSRWYEFLEFYVDGEMPRLSDGIRAAAPSVFEDEFGMPGLSFEPDRFTEFTDDQFDEAKAAYEAQPDVRVLFDVGAADDLPGSPNHSFEADYAEWPPADLGERSFWFDADGKLADEKPDAEGIDSFTNDPKSGPVTFFGKKGYQLMSPTWDFNWVDFDDGDAVAYVSAPMSEDVVIGGPGYAELEVEIPDGDANVQVSVSLIDAAGTEWHITSGLLRLSDRKVNEDLSDGLRIGRTFTEEDAADMPTGDFDTAKVALPSFAQAFRAGDRIKVTVSSPGRDFGAWSFETIGDEGTPRDIARGGAKASRLVVGVLPGIDEVPPLVADCPSLRGQACRSYEPRTNVAASDR
ncbi:MAG: CocE/NonD family hydrolase [Aquihabitans sp.]